MATVNTLIKPSSRQLEKLIRQLPNGERIRLLSRFQDELLENRLEQIFKKGRSFAKKKGIKESDILDAVMEVRYGSRLGHRTLHKSLSF